MMLLVGFHLHSFRKENESLNPVPLTSMQWASPGLGEYSAQRCMTLRAPLSSEKDLTTYVKAKKCFHLISHCPG